MLTEKMKKNYLKNPHKCPKCGKTDIDARGFDFEDEQVWSEVICNDCGFEWRDIYTLSDIIEKI